MNPTYDFTGQAVFVTGVSSGMGLAAARAFAEAGDAVGLADIDEAAVTTAAKELTDAGHHALALVCDVTDPAPGGPPQPRHRPSPAPPPWMSGGHRVVHCEAPVGS